MFFSEFLVNPGRREARALVASPQRLHAAVLDCFPPGQANLGDRRVIWRLDGGPHRSARLLIVSPLRPDFRGLAERAGWTTGESGRSTPYDRFLEGLKEGQNWRFRLVANPTYRLPKKPGEKRGRRVGHVTVGHQLQWLLRKADGIGINMASAEEGLYASVTGRGLRRFTKGSDLQVTMATAQFDGILRVEDAALLRSALVSGIGPGKAYGHGLMTLAPIRG